jgi:hypothetical protein
MAESARKESTRRRAGNRDRRRSLISEPFEALDEAARGGDGARSEAVAAAKHAARTAAAAALAGGVAGALKALAARRGQAREEKPPENDTESEPEPEEDDHRGQAAPDAPDAPSGEEEEEQDDEPRAEAERRDDSREEHEHHRGASSDDVETIVDSARTHVANLLEKEPESVSGISRTGKAWSVTVEVVEVRRVPDSTDVLASYDVVIDDDGNLVRLERGRRYRRSQVEEDR